MSIPDWVIAIDAIGECYVNEDIDGDPGRTCRIEDAERYATENEARTNMRAIERKYPGRKYAIKPVYNAELRRAAD